ncbi:alpha-glucan family phosphorylase [Jiangella rhizosphaerae]|uniref:glycogen phosphorylase n=1 Tax=Jiangella rhizosphaerae TaxID=2293569 RepID=A0A418KMR6_9ACTN|nr:alpha-glucan family phosphorylase [Jiangella rhizosphaerae]RIQ20215.1 glycosyltransferase family 1 protein [Jiangella rhizosphaerae]
MRAIRRLMVRTVLPEPLAALGDLVTNLRWSWHQPTQDLFSAVDPRLWEEVGHDPVRLLGEVRPERLAELAADPAFLGLVHAAHDDLRHYLTEARWYQDHDGRAPRGVAYFSPEFGITHVLPQYSGGLGILAGDHLKAASDLGVPIIGVGLLYRHGYFVQSLSREGWQQERYPVVDPDNMPLVRLREPDGTPAHITVGMPGGRVLTAAVWVAQVGRVPLLLLDSYIDDNGPAEREVTDRLYGGSREHRLLQEMLLGIGGVRAVRAYCRITGTAAPEVFHTNEGHAGFLGLERIRELVEERGLTYEAALEFTRAGTVFTTHTPVPAGIDRFPMDLVKQHFGGDNASPGLAVEQILALGAEDYEGGDPSVFNMAVMGLRLAARANGVSTLHGEVSRGMFAGLWPSFDEREVPIGSITNGVHAPTWVAPEILRLEEKAVAGGGWMAATAAVSDADLWSTKRALRARLVESARARLRDSWRGRGASEAELGWIDDVLDPGILTIGFARRVPSYKRLTLMLRDPARLKALLLHPERPVQFVIAGKAHPADDGGKRMIQEMVRFADDPEVRHRIVFLPDYGIGMAQALYPGCDVWLNNPLRPYEACGTSGMKAALNAGLNLSIRDGWWDEWSDGVNGWDIPSAEGVQDPEYRDSLEATALYELLENEIGPRFYDVDGEDIPRRWVEQLRHTLTTLGPKVQATRMVRDYVEALYTPAAESSRSLNADFDGAVSLADWKERVRAAWPQVRVDHVETTTVDAFERGQTLRLHAFVTLGALTPDDVDVQVVHGPVDDADNLRDPAVTPMTMSERLDNASFRFDGEVQLDRTGAFGYTVRIVPRHSLLGDGAELGLAALPN